MLKSGHFFDGPEIEYIIINDGLESQELVYY